MDAREFANLEKYPEELLNLDILDGSPPCSTFSTSGKREKAWGVMKKFAEGQKLQRLDDLFFVYDLDRGSIGGHHGLRLGGICPVGRVIPLTTEKRKGQQKQGRNQISPYIPHTKQGNNKNYRCNQFYPRVQPVYHRIGLVILTYCNVSNHNIPFKISAAASLMVVASFSTSNPSSRSLFTM